MRVAPRAGAWIETRYYVGDTASYLASPPARGRGLKLSFWLLLRSHQAGAPRAGAWIETSRYIQQPTDVKVAPRAGAWIETCYSVNFVLNPLRRPPRGGVD